MSFGEIVAGEDGKGTVRKEDSGKVKKGVMRNLD